MRSAFPAVNFFFRGRNAAIQAVIREPQNIAVHLDARRESKVSGTGCFGSGMNTRGSFGGGFESGVGGAVNAGVGFSFFSQRLRNIPCRHI